MNTADYWENRYKSGGTSGAGLCLDFKGEVINGFVKENGIKSIIDFGCGDGRMAKLINVDDYSGLDISPTSIEMCKNIFENDKTREFKVYKHPVKGVKPAELALSLDVIFHLLEDETYQDYMEDLFDYAKKYVIIFSSNTEEPIESQSSHLRQHKFTDWVEKNRKEWKLIEKIRNKYPYDKETGWGSIADFYIFQLCSEKGAEYYDKNFVRFPDMSRYKEIYKRVKEIVGNQSVLDFGCGLAELSKYVKNYRGFDIAQKTIEKKQKEGLDVWVGDVLDKKNHKKADYYTILEVLEHIQKDREALKLILGGQKILLSVPSFKDVSHVRTFNENSLRERYKGIIDIENITQYVWDRKNRRWYESKELSEPYILLVEAKKIVIS